ncbi:hypothetical protein PSE10B_46340 [Pseudomonas amygdali pv. eriobotryae]|nr:hypothetical protein PSE10B_46340 [Pseudomonas amygdali pv. eriobotryae]
MESFFQDSASLGLAPSSRGNYIRHWVFGGLLAGQNAEVGASVLSDPGAVMEEVIDCCDFTRCKGGAQGALIEGLGRPSDHKVFTVGAIRQENAVLAHSGIGRLRREASGA